MRATLVILYGFWALAYTSGKPKFTSFHASVPASKVLKVVRRDNPDVRISVGQLEMFQEVAA